jgi:23S rRNA G2069 N7-methylase RlmK/C1962 C5-methylase RlmI
MSNTYLDWAAENFALNGLDCRRVDPQDLLGPDGLPDAEDPPGHHPALPPFRLIRADALRFLEGAAEEGLSWDTIILDPPAFSNSKKMTGNLDLKRDHKRLITRCLGLLAPGGTLWFSANTRNFSLEPGEFPGTIIEDIREKIRDEDFRGKRMPATYTFTLGTRNP